jgi:hypothetical protein
MIEVQQGTPGSGKSAVAVARLARHLKLGGVVAANFSLVDGWSDIVASQSWASKLSEQHRYKSSSCLHKRFHRVDSLAAIRALDPKASAVGRHASKKGKYMEGQGLLILDEAQLIFNSRGWEKNMGWIEFFTQHRKLGWNVILIAHDIQMIDSQIRPLCEYESRFRNLQKVKIPILGLPMSPFPLFLCIRRYAGISAGSGQIFDREVFPLPLWAAKLYDSCLVFSAEDWGQKDTLPELCGKGPAAPLCGVVGSPRVTVDIPRPRLSTLSGPHWDSYVHTLTPSSALDLTGMELPPLHI